MSPPISNHACGSGCSRPRRLTGCWRSCRIPAWSNCSGTSRPLGRAGGEPVHGRTSADDASFSTVCGQGVRSAGPRGAVAGPAACPTVFDGARLAERRHAPGHGTHQPARDRGGPSAGAGRCLGNGRAQRRHARPGVRGARPGALAADAGGDPASAETQ